jgi:hypothetical protein
MTPTENKALLDDCNDILSGLTDIGGYGRSRRVANALRELLTREECERSEREALDAPLEQMSETKDECEQAFQEWYIYACGTKDGAHIRRAWFAGILWYMQQQQPPTRIEQQAVKSTNLASVLDTVSVAYGYLWHVNNEPGTPCQYPPEKAAYLARRLLRDLLTKEQRGNGINEVMQRMSPTHPHYVAPSDPDTLAASPSASPGTNVGDKA